MSLKKVDFVFCFLHQFAETSQKKEILQKSMEKSKIGRENTVSWFSGGGCPTREKGSKYSEFASSNESLEIH